MKPKQQRIAIAEACGWQWKTRMKDSIRVWSNPPLMVCYDCGLPDYLNDLNAMHEAEKVLTGKQLSLYRKWLPIHEWYLIRATAAQRAEAFLKTLNLWKP